MPNLITKKISRKILFIFITMWVISFIAAISEFIGVHHHGISIVRYYLITLLVASVATSIMAWLFLDRLLVKRIQKLNQQLSEISKSHLFSKRINIKGNDELASIAHEINRFLEVIDASQLQLETRIHAHGTALQKVSIDLQQEILERRFAETELQASKERLDYLAHYDVTTKLPNQVSFQKELNQLILDAQIEKKSFAVLMMGIDRFEDFEDAYGYPTSEQVIRIIVKRLKNHALYFRLLAQMSRSEFGFLIQPVKESGSLDNLVKFLLEASAQPLIVAKREFYFTASIGISFFPKDGKSAVLLEKNAMIAMYRARSDEGEHVKYYMPEMSIKKIKRVELESRLRKAILDQKFFLVYQPKFDLGTQKIVGVEALVRWEDAEEGVIYPSDFIPLAEETGLIVPLGEWILREACAINKSWQTAGFRPIFMAINLSGVQFAVPNITEIITKIADEAGLEYQYLELEITESAVVRDKESAILKVKNLYDKGIKLSIDDFGTGYASMSYLKQFSINYLKIDRSFIIDLPDNQDSKAIVNAIILLGHTLGMKIVAEGIETTAQLQYLQNQGCDIGQGYLLSRPVDREGVEKLLRQ